MSSPPSNAPPPPSGPNRQLSVEEIEARLQKLRAETKDVVEQKDLEERLARLANRDPNYYSSSEPPIKIYQLLRKEQGLSDDQKADGLMERMMDELRIDTSREESGQSIDEEIGRRLAKLREGLNAQMAKSPQSNNHSTVGGYNLDAPPKTARQWLEQILSEPDDVVGEHQKMNVSEDEEAHEEMKTSDDEVDSWCITCNEDGQVKCLDCEDDVYCQECFNELHRDSDMRRHRKVAFQKKKRSSKK